MVLDGITLVKAVNMAIFVIFIFVIFITNPITSARAMNDTSHPLNASTSINNTGGGAGAGSGSFKKGPVKAHTPNPSTWLPHPPNPSPSTSINTGGGAESGSFKKGPLKAHAPNPSTWVHGNHT